MAEGRFYSFRQVFITMPPVVKILFVILIVFLFLILSSILSLIIAVPVYGVSMAEIMNAITYPGEENLYLVKYFQVIQTVFVFIVPGIFAAWIFSHDTFGYLKAKKGPSIVSVLLVFLLMAVTIPFLNAATELNSMLDLPVWLDKLEKLMLNLEESGAKLTELFIRMDNFRDLAFNLIMIAVLPAIGEEFLFRGVLQNLFTEWTKNKHFGVLLGAFVFSFFHLQFFGFLPRFLLGIYLGYLLVWSGTIWLPVLGHFINNAFIVTYYYFSSGTIGETYLENVGADRETIFMALISLALTMSIFLLIYRHEKRSITFGNDPHFS